MELVNYNLDANQISYLIKIPLIGLGFLLQLPLSECLTLRAPQDSQPAVRNECPIFPTEPDSGLALDAQPDRVRQAARNHVLTLERW